MKIYESSEPVEQFEKSKEESSNKNQVIDNKTISLLGKRKAPEI